MSSTALAGSVRGVSSGLLSPTHVRRGIVCKTGEQARTR
jgi:hypothetical protein